MSGISLIARLSCAASLLVVVGCTPTNEITDPPAALGDFSLGYNVVSADNAEMMPPSRAATPEEWEAVLTRAIDERFSRYDGDKLYHLGVAVDGFALAIPGVPVVMSPKSALVISVTVWDDEAGKKLNEKPHRLTVLENVLGEDVDVAELTKSREQQMETLAFNAAGAIERYLAEHASEWFGETGGMAETAPIPELDEAVVLTDAATTN